MAEEQADRHGKDENFCQKCNLHYFYRDDSHAECMRCRGVDHSCDLCAHMGPRSKERTLEWLKKAKKTSNSVSFADLENFGKSLTSRFESLLENMLVPAAQANARTVGNGSNGAGQAAGVNPPIPGTSSGVGQADRTRSAEIILEEDDEDDA